MDESTAYLRYSISSFSYNSTNLWQNNVQKHIENGFGNYILSLKSQKKKTTGILSVFEEDQEWEELVGSIGLEQESSRLFGWNFCSNWQIWLLSTCDVS